MKQLSVSSISPTLKKLGSPLFIFLLLCGVGYQTTEMAALHLLQSGTSPDQASLTQASVFISSSQLAMPRVTTINKGLRHSVPFLPLLVLLPHIDVERPSLRILSLSETAPTSFPSRADPTACSLSLMRRLRSPEGFNFHIPGRSIPFQGFVYAPFS